MAGMGRVVGVAVGLLTFVTAAPAPARTPEWPAPVVRPGTMWSTADGSGGCTVGFLFAAGRRVLASTAGHCSRVVGRVIHAVAGPMDGPFTDVYEDPPGPRIGRVVYTDGGTLPDLAVGRGPDLALIELDRGVPFDPAVCLFGGPTRTDAELSDAPAVLRMYGIGEGVGYVREGSITVLPGRSGLAPHRARAAALEYAFPFGSGDSGAPIIDDRGRAVGLFSMPTHTPRLRPQVARAEEAMGLDLELLTAPLATRASAGLEPRCHSAAPST